MAEQNRAPNPFQRDKKRVFLDMYTIYEHPKDYPTKFVVRRWMIVDGEQREVAENACQLADSLVEARTLIPPGYFLTTRAPEDDPVIVETWL